MAIGLRQEGAEEPFRRDQERDANVRSRLESHEIGHFLVSIVETFFIEDALSQGVDAVLELELWDQDKVVGLGDFFLFFASSQDFALTLRLWVNQLLALPFQLPLVSHSVCNVQVQRQSIDRELFSREEMEHVELEWLRTLLADRQDL